MKQMTISPTVRARLSHHLLVFVAATFLSFVGVGTATAGPVFEAYLDGNQAVLSNSSSATGFATFEFDNDFTTLTYELWVWEISNITMAHIHLGGPDVNGPVVLWLYPSGPPPLLISGPYDGLLSSGTVTAANLVGPLAGLLTMTDLYDAMRTDNTYVNVHTSAYPAGEIRGQIRGVPEPTTIAIVALGLMLLGLLRHSRGFDPDSRRSNVKRRAETILGR